MITSLAVRKNNLITNFSALTVMQMVQYAAPLIVLPYLVRIIGPANFGVISFAQAIAYYFALIPDLGASLYATREISLIKDDRVKLSAFVSGILILKGIILLVSLLVYAAIVFFVPRFHSEIWVFIFGMGYIIGETYIPGWFFMGIEKMINITIGISIIRILGLILIFIFIHQPDHYIYVPLLNSVALLVGVVFMYCQVFFRNGVEFVLPDRVFMVKILRESMPLFVSNVMKNLNAGINIIVLGFFCSNTIVGYYSAAEKLIKTGMGLLTQLSNVFYPYISRMLKESMESGLTSIKTGFIAGMLLSIPAAILVITYPDLIVDILLGNSFSGSVSPMRIMGILFFVIGMSNILGNQVLLPFDKGFIYMRALIIGFVSQIVLVLMLAPQFQERGAALAFVLSQIIVSVLMGFEVKKLSFSIIQKSSTVKLVALALGLVASVLFSLFIKLGMMWSLGVFLVTYVILIVSLRLVDLKGQSIIL